MEAVEEVELEEEAQLVEEVALSLHSRLPRHRQAKARAAAEPHRRARYYER